MPEDLVASLEQIIARSALLKRTTDMYSWTRETQTVYAEGILSTIGNPSDWRIEELLKIGREHELHIEIGQSGNALDAGSGSGSLIIAARQRGVNIVGVDCDSASIDLARDLAKASDISETETTSLFVQADLSDIPFPNNHFSLITSHVVIEHVDDVVAVLAEFARCLKPGGILWLVGPDYRFPFEAHYRIPWLPFMNKRVVPVWLDLFEKPVHGLSTFHYVTLPHCLAVLETLGLETLSAKTTTPERKIREELDALLGNSRHEYLQNDEGAIRELATIAKSSGFIPTETAFLVLSRKPTGRIYPSCARVHG